MQRCEARCHAERRHGDQRLWSRACWAQPTDIVRKLSMCLRSLPQRRFSRVLSFYQACELSQLKELAARLPCDILGMLSFSAKASTFGAPARAQNVEDDPSRRGPPITALRKVHSRLMLAASHKRHSRNESEVIDQWLYHHGRRGRSGSLRPGMGIRLAYYARCGRLAYESCG